jgi:hypothetical protein
MTGEIHSFIGPFTDHYVVVFLIGESVLWETSHDVMIEETLCETLEASRGRCMDRYADRIGGGVFTFETFQHTPRFEGLLVDDDIYTSSSCSLDERCVDECDGDYVGGE